MYPDEWPNNHILNTLLTKLSIIIFGAHQWSVRLPNLLFFFLYTAAVYRILRFVLTEYSWFFIPFALLFISNPYMFDFFATCRGYGMSIALSAFSASLFITGFARMRTSHIWWGLFLALLASYANFTLLLFWVAASCIAGVYFIIRRTKTKQNVWIPYLIMVTVSIAYLALIYTPIKKMQSTNQFTYWTSNGFFQDTVNPLIEMSCFESGLTKPFTVVAYAGFFLILFSLLYSLYQWKKAKFQLSALTQSYTIGAVLLIGTVIVNILQTWIMGTPNLFGRTAMFFYPLYLIAIVCTYPFVRTWIRNKALRLFLVIVIAFFASYHFLRATRPDVFREWFYDGNTFEVLAIIKPDKEGEMVSLETNWLFSPSFQFHNEVDVLTWLELRPYNKEINPKTDADYYYVRLEDTVLLSGKYSVVINWDNNYLMKRVKE